MKFEHTEGLGQSLLCHYICNKEGEEPRIAICAEIMKLIKITFGHIWEYSTYFSTNDDEYDREMLGIWRRENCVS